MGSLTIAGKYCPRTPDPALFCLHPARLLLHEFICARWSQPGSPLTKFHWRSLRAVAKAESLIWVQAIAYFLREERWATTRGVATQTITAAFWLSLQLQPIRGRDCRKRRRSCQDTLAVPSSVNRPEDHSLVAVTQSGVGWIDRNLEVEHQDQTRDRIIGDDRQSPITEDMDEFGKIGVKPLSYNQSLTHSAYDSAESIADLDLEDVRCWLRR